MTSALLLLVACRGDSTDTAVGAPGPWEDLAPIALDPFRHLLDVQVDEPVAPTRLVPLDWVYWTGVQDGDATHMLDARYRNSSKRECLDPSRFPDVDDGVDRRGGCAEGEAELRRGLWPVALVAEDSSGSLVWGADGDGGIYQASADLQGVNPLDWMRPQRINEIDLKPEFMVGGSDSTAWLAAGDQLVQVDEQGQELSRELLPGEVLDLASFAGWVCAATTAGVWSAGSVTDVIAARVVADDGRCLASIPSEGRITGALTDVTVADLSGPFALDRINDQLYVATPTGLTIVRETGQSEAAIGPVVDVAVNEHGEVTTLAADGTVSVYTDETLYTATDHPPLHAMTMAFFENPHQDDSEVACNAGDDNMADYLASAEADRALLDDLPFPTALGISPAAIQRAADCDLADRFAALAADPRTEVGALFHELPDCGTDQDCHDDALIEEAGRFASAGMSPTWMSGAATQDTETDWVHAVLATGLPARYLFFGLSTSPSIGSEDLDPRAKEPYPWRGAVPWEPWRVSSAADGEANDPDGALQMYPGQNTPAFNLAACPNLLVKECHIVGEGGGVTVDPDDMQVLDLLLHRALADRYGSAEGAFYFHLPAMELYDYTTDCTVQDRVWSGETCQGAALQSWMFDVYARFVSAGVVELSLPSELP